jgi:hypothetical protein
VIVQLTRLGRDYAFVFSEAQMQELGFTPDTEFELSSENGRLILTPVDPGSINSRKSRIQAARSDLHERFGDAMKRLAE